MVVRPPKPRLKFLHRFGDYYHWGPADDLTRTLIPYTTDAGILASAHVGWFWRGKHEGWQLDDAVRIREARATGQTIIHSDGTIEYPKKREQHDR